VYHPPSTHLFVFILLWACYTRYIYLLHTTLILYLVGVVCIAYRSDSLVYILHLLPLRLLLATMKLSSRPTNLLRLPVLVVVAATFLLLAFDGGNNSNNNGGFGPFVQAFTRNCPEGEGDPLECDGGPTTPTDDGDDLPPPSEAIPVPVPVTPEPTPVPSALVVSTTEEPTPAPTAAQVAATEEPTTSPPDDDQDGVVDLFDFCPETPAGEAVDPEGCSDSQKDSDGDGVLDYLDICPFTPVDETADPSTGCSFSQLDRYVCTRVHG